MKRLIVLFFLFFAECSSKKHATEKKLYLKMKTEVELRMERKTIDSLQNRH